MALDMRIGDLIIVAEKVGVEALDQRQRFEPADEARRPGRRLGR
jgi:hypothetical protein